MFKDRKEAGALLAQKLSRYAGDRDALVLAIPRGGVAVAYEVAQRLGLPLDIVVVKKIGHPGNEELAVGATGLGAYVLNEDIAGDVPEEYIREQVRIKQREARARYEFLRGRRPPSPLKGRTVIVIDDGIATGATMAMAVQVVRSQSPKRVVIAIPVAPPDAVERLAHVADEVVCLSRPASFTAIGEFYQDFTQVEDEEARRLLQEASKWRARPKARRSR